MPRGETPVPCVRCNQTVKFTDLTALARDLGAERAGDRPLCAARGRARRAGAAPRGRPGARPELVPVRHHARAARLSRCSRWAACRTRRRCGRWRRGWVWRWRTSRTARTSASCPAGSYADVVARLRPEPLAPGEIVDRAGQVLGRHDGIARFTVGQAQAARRRPREVAGARAGGRGARRAAPARGGRPARPTGTDQVRLREVNWLIAPPTAPLRCQVKLRARDVPRPAAVRATADGRRGGVWTRRRCRPPGRPACSTPATGCWAADSSWPPGG